MTCRHDKNDPACSSNQYMYSSPAPVTPDAEKFTIEQFERVGPHVVLKVKYPNCRKCAYEGAKVMVFLNISEADLVRWRRIDPHFRDPRQKIADHEAPSPAARFPASSEGWRDAVAYAESRSRAARP